MAVQAKRQARAVVTFEEAARTVHAMHVASWRNEKHAAQFLNSLDTYAFPRLGGRNVSDIASADALAVLQPIWLQKPETARRVRQRIGTVMKYAIAQGWRSDNPAENIGRALPRHTTEKRNRKAMAYSEVTGCIAAVHASGATLATKLALEFLILTACRSGEVRGGRWDEVDISDLGSATGDHDPRAWAEVLRPTLSDHGGWGLFLGTPRGDNMFKEMADAARANLEGNWLFLELKASETCLIAPEELRDASRQMSRAQYLAEYECSFEAGALGAYYAEDIATLVREDRVTTIQHERLADVYCSWDLGIGDTTALWTFQCVGNEIRFLDCMEDSGKDLGHYVDWVKALPYQVHEHILPHDAEARELQAGNSRLEFLQMRGSQLPRPS